MQALQRHGKQIGFDFLLDKATITMAGIEGPGQEIVNGKAADGSALYSTKNLQNRMHPTMFNEGLDYMNDQMIGFLKQTVDQLAEDGSAAPIDLFRWTVHAVAIASTDAVYGPENPYRSPEVEKAFL